MKQTINYINAGIIITQARMAGLDLIGTITLAKLGRLHCDINSAPHRATVVRLVKMGWGRMAAQSNNAADHNRLISELDTRAAKLFPAEWAAMDAMPNGNGFKDSGKKRRKIRAKLRAMARNEEDQA